MIVYQIYSHNLTRPGKLREVGLGLLIEGIVIPQCRLTAVFHEIVRTHQKLEKHLENASQNKC